MPNVKLEKETILHLLRQADERWFAQHSGSFNYEIHLDFIADYIAKHYKGGNYAENKLHHACSRSPSSLEAKARRGHSDTPSQGLLNCSGHPHRGGQGRLETSCTSFSMTVCSACDNKQ